MSKDSPNRLDAGASNPEAQDYVLSSDSIFRQLFESSSKRQVLLDADAPDFTIRAVSDTYLELVNMERQALVGRGVFEVFPESPTAEQHLLREALEKVVKKETPQSLAAYRYDIPDRTTPKQTLERYWSPSLTPVKGGDASLQAILVDVEEATDFVLRERYIHSRHAPDDQSSPRSDKGPEDPAVLLVDPDDQRRRHLACAFTVYWDVEEATSVAEAQEVLGRFSPDVVLTTTNLPDRKGTRCVPLFADATQASVIILVEQTNAQRFKEAFEAGADDVIGGPASVREIMARVQTQFAEQALREATQEHVHYQYQQLFMQAPVAISLLEGPDKIYTLANPALYDIVGPRQLIGLPLRKAFPEPEMQNLFDRLDEVYETGEPFFASQVPITTGKDRQTRYVTFSYQPFRDVEGHIRGVASFAYDVTEQVEMQQAVERESERKDTFLAMLGHELRNPLTPIILANDFLQDQVDDLDRETLTWATGIIANQAEQLRHHVDDLLDLGRIQHGRIAIERSATLLSKILDDALEASRPAIDERQQILEVTAPTTPLCVDVDPARITQVITNLVDNASKYTPKKGRIWLEAKLSNNSGPSRLTIEVSDQGQGITPSELPYLFEPFAQLDASLDRAHGGLGLGLAVVKGIVEMHGGTVEAHSEGRGQGSRFVIALPVEVTTPEKPSTDSAQNHLTSRRVLLVDDIPEITSAVSRTLRRRGATVFTANSGEEALELAADTGCDFTHVLLDIGLPDIDGYEVARRLRQMPGGQALKIAAFTGYGLGKDIQKGRKAGFDHHLTKPASTADLIAFLRDDLPANSSI